MMPRGGSALPPGAYSEYEAAMAALGLPQGCREQEVEEEEEEEGAGLPPLVLKDPHFLLQAEALLSPTFMAAILSPEPMGDLAAILEQEEEEELQHKMAAGMEVATGNKMAAPIGYDRDAKMAAARELPAKMASPMAAMGGASKIATRSGGGEAQNTAVTWCTPAPKMAAAVGGWRRRQDGGPHGGTGKMAAMGFLLTPPSKMAASMSDKDPPKMATQTKMAAPMQ